MTAIQIVPLCVIYALALNIAASLAFAFDKTAARNGRRRIRESTLLWIALAGGSIGSIAAQHLIRHKTRKQPFKSQLYFIAILQAFTLIGVCVPDVRAFVLALVP